MANIKKGEGGCHCGAVRYEAEVDLDATIVCNCSICQKRGSILSAAPAGKFKLQKGADALTKYQFNKHRIDHLFCKTCGILSFAHGKGKDSSEMHMVNVRTMDGIEPDELHPKKIDGRSF